MLFSALRVVNKMKASSSLPRAVTKASYSITLKTSKCYYISRCSLLDSLEMSNSYKGLRKVGLRNFSRISLYSSFNFSSRCFIEASFRREYQVMQDRESFKISLTSTASITDWYYFHRITGDILPRWDRVRNLTTKHSKLPVSDFSFILSALISCGWTFDM